jgi:AcrR family transcriptional regulator
MPRLKKSATPAERWSLPAQQDRSRATRERLLDAAEIVFAKKGYDGARLADIAREAGCSVGAVYFRFKDKSALFSAIAESFIEDARLGFAALLSQAPAQPEQITRQFVSASAASFQRHRGLFRAIVERGIEHPQAMRSIFRFRDELATSLEDALHGGGKASSDISVRVMTQMVYGFLLAGILNERAPTRIDDARAVAGLADACVAYLARGKGRS